MNCSISVLIWDSFTGIRTLIWALTSSPLHKCFNVLGWFQTFIKSREVNVVQYYRSFSTITSVQHRLFCPFLKKGVISIIYAYIIQPNLCYLQLFAVIVIELIATLWLLVNFHPLGLYREESRFYNELGRVFNLFFSYADNW